VRDRTPRGVHHAQATRRIEPALAEQLRREHVGRRAFDTEAKMEARSWAHNAARALALAVALGALATMVWRAQQQARADERTRERTDASSGALETRDSPRAAGPSNEQRSGCDALADSTSGAGRSPSSKILVIESNALFAPAESPPATAPSPPFLWSSKSPVLPSEMFSSGSQVGSSESGLNLDRLLIPPNPGTPILWPPLTPVDETKAGDSMHADDATKTP